MTETNTQNEFYGALLRAQQRIGTIAKDKTNPYHQSKYADINDMLEMVKPILNDEGLLLMQPLTHVGGAPAISTIIMGYGTSIEYETVIPFRDDPQKAGSAITYFRRYALQSILALQVEDDDGEAARLKIKTEAKPAAKANPSQGTKFTPASEHTPDTEAPSEEPAEAVIIPTCSICQAPMKPTRAGSKNPFFCKHGSAWGVPVWPQEGVNETGSTE